MGSPPADLERSLAPASVLHAPASHVSTAMEVFVRLLSEAAHYSTPVLLTGERGSGKTAFAHTLHAMSTRAVKPFIRVDCLSGVGDLFGDARAARDGTLFLDDVGELSTPAQAAALALFDGARISTPHGARVVASTSRDLESDMKEGRFRQDLFYRLSVLEIRIPPLRERPDDILPIARAFVTALARRAGRPPPRLSPELERALVAHAWPGNVAELLGVLERLVILTEGPDLGVSNLPSQFNA